MILAQQVVRWESTVDPSLCGVELRGLEVPGRERHERLHSGKPTFVLAALGSLSPAEVAAALSKASIEFGNARACLAVDVGVLFRLDINFLRDRNIGVVLDRVDETTPLSAISEQAVEAVRFAANFVTRARSDGRFACILDAMLGLSRDLGIATLGTSPHPRRRSCERFDFDYTAAQAS
ncbi:MAG TPA: hypothetical protein VHM00_10920 [Caldimonas sp.]|jgi:hypothetical protein|nr:hypothetical protein [Caldimonas sp.]HEX2541579.1 hypothetical protein [Caldimonas sp.]